MATGITWYKGINYNASSAVCHTFGLSPAVLDQENTLQT